MTHDTKEIHQQTIFRNSSCNGSFFFASIFFFYLVAVALTLLVNITVGTANQWPAILSRSSLFNQHFITLSAKLTAYYRNIVKIPELQNWVIYCIKLDIFIFFLIFSLGVQSIIFVWNDMPPIQVLTHS